MNKLTDPVGTSVGLRGAILGLDVGCSLGLLVVTGLSEGCDDGESVFGDLEGPIEGESVIGDALGLTDGLDDGLSVGLSYEVLVRDMNDMNVM